MDTDWLISPSSCRNYVLWTSIIKQIIIYFTTGFTYTYCIFKRNLKTTTNMNDNNKVGVCVTQLCSHVPGVRSDKLTEQAEQCSDKYICEN